MGTKYTIKYKTFDSLIADVSDDLSSLADEGYIYPDKYLKIAEECNSKLSVKINPVKEDVITVSNGKGKLPNDFKLLDAVYLCLNVVQGATTNAGTIEYVKAPKYCYKDICNSCDNIAYVEDSKGMFTFVVYKKAINTLIYVQRILPVSIKSSFPFCSSSCRKGATTNVEVEIQKVGEDYYIISDYAGEYYISYVSEMVDDDGGLLILDHPLVTAYYEYALKERIFEDLWLNGTEEVQNKLSFAKERHREAKIEAIRFARTFDFAELKQVYFDNRKRFKLKYDQIIQE